MLCSRPNGHILPGYVRRIHPDPDLHTHVLRATGQPGLAGLGRERDRADVVLTNRHRRGQVLHVKVAEELLEVRQFPGRFVERVELTLGRRVRGELLS